MAEIALPATALPGDGAYAFPGRSAAAVAQSRVVYKTTAKKFDLARSDSASTCGAVGITQNGVGAANARLLIQSKGRITGLTGLTAGVVYVLADGTAGSIMPHADLAAGNRVVIIGYAVSATELELLIKDTGVTFA